MGVLVVRTIELTDAIEDIRRGMRVDAIHDHSDVHAVRFVNEVLEIVGGA